MKNNSFLATMISLASAAFGVVAALAWNTAIQSIFDTYLSQKSGVVGNLIYAVVITIIAVLVLSWLGKVAEKFGDKSKV
jgi:hypothetical protein